ncbi:hypothetical protein AAFC00_004915 [Neodothiora populina]|uniref:Endoplasmic reticulum-Golgi intermediate compartment protein n=1 Tax=Neodothiora populina TaxID=2781224 RepID=A0ABR3P409_9PEZI
MNGFTDSGLDESAFGENKASSIVQAFDAFPKTKPSYQTKTTSGGVWTAWVVVISLFLATTELQRWWVGDTTHSFSVEKGISHDLQINIDMVVAMRCEDIHINVQDASGDLILAAQALTKHPTRWSQWQDNKGVHALGMSEAERKEAEGRKASTYAEEDVHDYLGAAKRRKKFAKTPKLPRKLLPDSCRVFGILDGNKVQGDFHITARGHGYREFGQHLDHKTFNFSHIITELSFGPFYPGLSNPLDNTRTTTDAHFEKYQYFLSVVPTIYTTDAKALARINPTISPSSSDEASEKNSLVRWGHNTVFTNQYAVTEQSRPVPENQVPGVFVKYDIEPILLTIAEEWDGFLGLIVRLVNVVSGVLVAGGWCFQLSERAKEIMGRRRKRAMSEGVLHGRSNFEDEKKASFA